MAFMVYWDNKKKLYRIEKGTCCSVCDNEIKIYGFYYLGVLYTKESIRTLYCSQCKDKMQDDNKVVRYSIMPVSVVNQIPPNATPVLHKDIDVSATMSVFDAATDKAKAEKVIDNTKYARMESIEGATIGLPVSEREEKVEDIDLFFKRVKNSIPYDDSDKKLLE